jgi:hypothetical protein
LATNLQASAQKTGCIALTLKSVIKLAKVSHQNSLPTNGWGAVTGRRLKINQEKVLKTFFPFVSRLELSNNKQEIQ